MEDCFKPYAEAAVQMIRTAMREKGYSTNKELSAAYEAAYHDRISQSTITSMLQGQGHIGIATYVKIARLLDINIFSVWSDVFSSEKSCDNEAEPFERIFLESIFNSRHTFITDANNPVFDGYEGDYYTYFFQTISGRDNLLNGELRFVKNPSGHFKAFLSLHSGDHDESGNEIIKRYMGYLIYSVKTHVVSCLLLSAELGEICMIKFKQIPINSNKLACRMALAITASAGNPRLPTVHRFFFTRSQLSSDEQNKLKGQLLLNSSSIFISKRHLRDFIAQTTLPEAFRKRLNDALSQEGYVRVNEASLFDGSNPSKDEIDTLIQLRQLSEELRYNKISSKTDEYTFKFYHNSTPKNS